MRYAVIVDGLVTKVISWDGVSPWGNDEPADVIQCPSYVDPNWTYNAGEWVAPPRS